ncbi:hypothetical protein BC829DRAFT_488424 [Chytridium lagenaria]|nr:hypothetical protein BC829DRAFT_488424 [Chytridium lagenaria]
MNNQQQQQHQQQQQQQQPYGYGSNNTSMRQYGMNNNNNNNNNNSSSSSSSSYDDYLDDTYYSNNSNSISNNNNNSNNNNSNRYQPAPPSVVRQPQPYTAFSSPPPRPVHQLSQLPSHQQYSPTSPTFPPASAYPGSNPQTSSSSSHSSSNSRYPYNPQHSPMPRSAATTTSSATLHHITDLTSMPASSPYAEAIAMRNLPQNNTFDLPPISPTSYAPSTAASEDSRAGGRPLTVALENQIHRNKWVPEEGEEARGGMGRDSTAVEEAKREEMAALPPVAPKKPSDVTLDMVLQDRLKWPLGFSDFLFHLEEKGGKGATNCFAFFVAIDQYRDLYEEYRRHENQQQFLPSNVRSPKPSPSQPPLHQFNHGRNPPSRSRPLSPTDSLPLSTPSPNLNDTETPLLSRGELMDEFSNLCVQFLFKDSDQTIQITESERHHFLTKAADFIRVTAVKSPSALTREPPHPCIFDSVVADLRSNSLQTNLTVFLNTAFEVNASHQRARNFLRFGWFALILSLVIALLLIVVFQNASPYARLPLFMPVSWSVACFWQHRFRFCGENAFKNLADFVVSDGRGGRKVVTRPVVEPCVRNAMSRKLGWMVAVSTAFGMVVSVGLFFVPKLGFTVVP